MIDLRQVSKTYAKGTTPVHALRDVDLSIGRGEYVAILGPSGSGKSTLMHLMGCLDTPTAGTYHLDGRAVQDLSRAALADVRNHEIGFVFQSFNLLPRATAIDNVALPLVFGKVPAGRRLRRATELLERVGLGHRLEHIPAEMSGGERQRVALARALANEPSVILADEPTGNLDSASGAEVMALLDDLHGQGCTLVLVTHDTEVAEHTRRIIRVRDGRIVEDQPSAKT